MRFVAAHPTPTLPKNCLTKGHTTRMDCKTQRAMLVNKRASTRDLASFDAPLGHLSVTLLSLSVDLTSREAHVPWDPSVSPPPRRAMKVAPAIA